MKNKLGRSLALFVGFLLSCGLAIAHHGNSAYDEKNPLTVKGTVTEFAWSNPHVQIYFDVKDDRGNVAHWSVEILSPGKLLRLDQRLSEAGKPGFGASGSFRRKTV